MTWHRDFTANIKKFQRAIPDAGRGAVVYAGDVLPEDEHFQAVRFQATAALFGS